MNKIVSKKQLSDEVFKFVIEARDIAENAEPGQFLVVHQGGEGDERIPLTIADKDVTHGTVTLVFQTVGESTHRLAKLNCGDYIAHVLGPLGTPSEIEKFGHVVCVGGGIGLAPLYPIAKALKEAGNKVTIIAGARRKDLLVMMEENSSVDPDIIICTDDGSIGRKALVTEPLKELCESGSVDRVIAIGPPIMMKFCSKTTEPFKIPTVVSLNTLMVDGTGMCGCCRVSIGDQTKFVCVDGPDFDAHLVDWDNMFARMGTYKEYETEHHHKCHIDLHIEEGKA